MALFGRRAKDEATDEPGTLRGLVRASFARAGVAIVAEQDEPEALVADDGRTFPLASIRELTATLESEEVGPAVDGWVDQVLVAETVAHETVPADELGARIRVRLLPDDAALDADPRWDFGSGVSIILMLDLDGAVRRPHAEELVGQDVAALFDAGIRNVDAEPLTRREEVAPGVLLLGGDSLFTATKALDLPHLIATELGGAAPYGLVFGIPHRHFVLVHVLRDADSARAVMTLAQFTAQMADQDGVGGPLSPSAWFWNGEGRAVAISHPDPDGRIAITPTEALSTAMRAVSEIPGAVPAPVPASPAPSAEPSAH